MTRSDAIFAIIREARSFRMPSNTSVARVVRALRCLDLDDSETRYVLSCLDICRYETGEPYGKIKRIW